MEQGVEPSLDWSSEFSEGINALSCKLLVSIAGQEAMPEYPCDISRLGGIDCCLYGTKLRLQLQHEGAGSPFD